MLLKVAVIPEIKLAKSEDCVLKFKNSELAPFPLAVGRG
jgi:hypothetical protein